MPLKKSKGNMYEFVTHTWNPISGKCSHDCSYCYVKRWGKQNKIHINENEFKTNLGSNNFIFIGSGCDLFAPDIPDSWIRRVLDYISKFDNQYFFQTKNTFRMGDYIQFMPSSTKLCTTVESNRFIPELMGKTPVPYDRLFFLPLNEMITIEPIMDFDLYDFVNIILYAKPKQVNIGADSGRNNLPEPSSDKIKSLISLLEKFTIVHLKSNLKRLMK